MKLIVSEKPSVARQFAHALGINGGKKEGYIEGNGWVITWCVGHLVTLSYPEKYDPELKKWNLDALPFLPEKYRYEVIAKTRPQYKVVEELLKRADVVYNAGDSGREGEYIQRLVYTQAGTFNADTYLRVWIDSQTDEEIIRGIKSAKKEREYDNLSKAAYMRAIEDYALGINLSRALTLKFGYGLNKRLGIKDKKDRIVIAVGRVMTCVLGMIVDREREIENFKPTSFYKIDAKGEGITSHWRMRKGSALITPDMLYSDNGIKKKEDVQKLLEELKKDPSYTVESIEEKDEKKYAPLLYNLAELQADCSRRYKISPDETLKIAQSLYEKKYTTYPRTDARVVSTAVCKEIDKNISPLRTVPDVGWAAEEIMTKGLYKSLSKSKYCDDSKITDHYAIIPTGEGNTESLEGLEKQVYIQIVIRFLSVFFPPAVYKKRTAIFKHQTGELFYAFEKSLTTKGFLQVTGVEDNNDQDGQEKNDLSGLKKGQVIRDVDFYMTEGVTQPSKRYTSGSMVLAMENAGNLIEDEELRAQIKGSGIGTSATRAETIKKLCDNRYISLNKKTQVLTPTDIGFEIYDIVKESVPQLLNPKMTASWEKGLSGIEQGGIDVNTYRAKFENFVRKAVEVVKSKEAEAPVPIEKKEAGVCPVCGEVLYETEKSYFCSAKKKDDKKSCQFAFPKIIGGKALSEENTRLLLSGKRTELLTGLVGKSGKPFDAYIDVKKNGECKMEFPKEETQLKCPKCGNPMHKTAYTYECECGEKVWHTVSDRLITEEEMDKIFKEMIVGPMSGFKAKEGSPFSAYLVHYGGKLIVIRSIISGRKIGIDVVTKLLEDGYTEEISGFKSKAGKEFSARLKLNKDGQVQFDFPESDDEKAKNWAENWAKSIGFKAGKSRKGKRRKKA